MEGNLAAVEELTAQFFKTNEDDERKKSLRSFVNMSDAAQNTALHGAVFGGHIDVVKFLVEKCHADIFEKNNIGCSPIWLAAGYGRVECFQYLFSRIKVASKSSDGIVQHVFQNENSTGDSPLIASASRGHVEICKVLLESSLDDDFQDSKFTENMLSKENKNGDTPLTVTISNAKDEDDCIKLVNTMLKYDQMVRDEGSESKILNLSNKKGLTPLLIACERNLPRVITLLLETWKAKLGSDQQGNSPIGIASFCGNMDAAEAVLKAISSSGGKIGILNNPNDKGCTPLWLACRTGNSKMTNLLLEAGADPSLRNEENISPLEVAEKYKKEEVLKVLNERILADS